MRLFLKTQFLFRGYTHTHTHTPYRRKGLEESDGGNYVRNVSTALAIQASLSQFKCLTRRLCVNGRANAFWKDEPPRIKPQGAHRTLANRVAVTFCINQSDLRALQPHFTADMMESSPSLPAKSQPQTSPWGGSVSVCMCVCSSAKPYVCR